jgi:hypothetical protein
MVVIASMTPQSRIAEDYDSKEIDPTTYNTHKMRIQDSVQHFPYVLSIGSQKGIRPQTSDLRHLTFLVRHRPFSCHFKDQT